MISKMAKLSLGSRDGKITDEYISHDMISSLKHFNNVFAKINELIDKIEELERRINNASK